VSGCVVVGVWGWVRGCVGAWVRGCMYHIYIYVCIYIYICIIYIHRDLWPKQHVLDLSSHPAVRRVVALGTILIVELKEHDGAPGYQSQVTIIFSKVLYLVKNEKKFISALKKRFFRLQSPWWQHCGSTAFSHVPWATWCI
jgi:hypothetical protein